MLLSSWRKSGQLLKFYFCGEYAYNLRKRSGLGFDVRVEANIETLTADAVKPNASEDVLSSVMRKSRFWQVANSHSLNERQRSVLNRLLDGFVGKFTSSKYAALCKCSQETALRDITANMTLPIMSIVFVMPETTFFSSPKRKDGFLHSSNKMCVLHFLCMFNRKTPFEGTKKAYLVATCAEKELTLVGFNSVIMPQNYIVLGGTKSGADNKKILSNATPKIEQIREMRGALPVEQHQNGKQEACVGETMHSLHGLYRRMSRTSY